ncbi:hypothetical protein KKH27_01780 [bacterium]|nr:hypothetical protein [bacterium]MBU1984752.1 hypothetical protein [bacterium]
MNKDFSFPFYLTRLLWHAFAVVVSVLAMVPAAQAEWRFLPRLNGWSFSVPMMNRNGRLITTEYQERRWRLDRRFVILDVPTGQRLFDRYWTWANNGERPFCFMLLDTNNSVSLMFYTETSGYFRRYAADGTMTSEQTRPFPDSFPRHLWDPEISLWGPGYLHTSWWDYEDTCAYVQTCALDLRVLRTDTIRFPRAGWWGEEVEPDGSGGYYLLCPVTDRPYSRNLYHMSSGGVLQGPVMFDILPGFSTFALSFAPGSRTLLVMSGDLVGDIHQILYCIHLDPDNLSEISRELISSFINFGDVEAAQDTIWFVRQVTPPVPPVIHQGIAVWAYTQESGWVATDSLTNDVWPNGGSSGGSIMSMRIFVYPYLVITTIGGSRFLVRYPEP